MAHNTCAINSFGSQLRTRKKTHTNTCHLYKINRYYFQPKATCRRFNNLCSYQKGDRRINLKTRLNASVQHNNASSEWKKHGQKAYPRKQILKGLRIAQKHFTGATEHIYNNASCRLRWIHVSSLWECVSGGRNCQPLQREPYHRKCVEIASSCSDRVPYVLHQHGVPGCW